MDRNEIPTSAADNAPGAIGAAKPAAKLQVLGLAPLKHRLGPRWEKLSGLVHKLFEAAIGRVQGPYDHFIAVDELSYVVTFRHLSLAETDIACVAIAKEVCNMLFGNQIDEISVRSLVAAICEPVEPDKSQWGKQIESMLEESGTETVVTLSAHSGVREPVISIAGQVQKPALPAMQAIEQARGVVEQLGLKLGLFPIWELRKNTSSALFLYPWSSAGRTPVSGRRALEGMHAPAITDTEITLLNAAAACAMRIHDADKICAVGVGVSYATLSAFHTRIRYVTALQKIRVPSSSPIMLKIEQIPAGTPVARIAELVAMIRFPNLRLILEFQTLAAIPELDIQVGAAGYGGAMPANADAELAVFLAEKLVQRAGTQKGFAFIEKLDSILHASAAYSAGVRFGTGSGLSTWHLPGLDTVPDFPMALAASR
jgi:hypothetical protein